MNSSAVNDLKSLISGKFSDPFSLLGAHPESHEGRWGVVVRAFLPGAKGVFVEDLDPEREVKARLISRKGLFEAFISDVKDIFPYHLNVDFGTGRAARFYDCYSFMPVLSDYDLYLFGQGNNLRIYERLGSHLMRHQGVSGVLFAVWAPSASRVSVIGDFNQWDGRRHQMRNRGPSGVWELFVPHLKEGLLYKYEIRTQDGTILIKSDPYAFCFEQRPKTAAVVHDLDKYQWDDQKWISKRSSVDYIRSPMAVYEVHLGSWKRRTDEGNAWINYREAADELIPYVKDMGFNYIELLPISEHPFDGSWGYQVTGYYAATSRYGSPEDLMHFIDRCHNEDIGVILDWVPAHFPKDPHALEFFDGTHLYEHEDPRQGEQKDWNTLIFNYGRNEVSNFLIANALFWLEKYHFDGLRIDAVASMLYLDYSRMEGEWIPNKYGGRENLEAIEFIKKMNTKIYEQFPGVMTIAEESTAWPGVTLPVHLGGLGFLFKWNMGWMHDMLTFMSKDPLYRRYHMDMLTFALLYAFHENFILPLSHDEVVHGKSSLLSKMPGDDWQKFSNLRLLLGYMYGEPGKKMIFMGGEFGQRWEWDHDQSLQWHLLKYEPHITLKNYVKELNRIYLTEPALYETDTDFQGFEWIDFRDADASVVSFIRKDKASRTTLIFIFNFTPAPRLNYRIGAPRRGYYKEIMNSDAACFGGSNIGLGGGIESEEIPYHGRPFSLNLRLPPLAMLLLKITE
ncbi:MAG: 1,4-alpha-glucan branching protein GlgB [Deltaproteobacteria bacterium]|nr:1,4-alpha-glucan branching protein GlgB [Deltaproteobacteria bacterium]